MAGLNLTVYGPRRELHSGHYGNWAPNPAMMLARLLVSMKDDTGRVTIKGFYDGIVPLTATEAQALADAPAIDSALRDELWLGWTEGGGQSLAELINQPSLNIRGLESGAVGAQTRNVVPARATASLDLRLVKGLDHRAQVERVLAHIRQQGYEVIQEEPTAEVLRRHAKVARVTVEPGYNAVRTSMDLPVAQRVVAAVREARGPVVSMPTLGGSVPLVLIEEALHVPMIGIPIANHDNNQHSANENLRLANLWDGIETMAALMTMAP